MHYHQGSGVEMREERHVGIIRIDLHNLLRLLKFEGATVHGVEWDFDQWQPDELLIKLEHPSMPKVEVGDMLQTVNTLYATEVFVTDRGERYERTKRLEPEDPK